VFWYKFIN